MARLLLRSHQPATGHAGAHEVWERNLIGNNVGNLLFSFSAERQLSTAGNVVLPRRERSKAFDAGWIAENVDHVVIPLANAFRRSYLQRLDALSELIEKIDVPVTVLGVGAQATLDGANHDADGSIAAGVQRFVAAVLDHGPSIGVRGEYTREYLRGLGFPDDGIDIIGCPSMFLHGDRLDLRPLPEITADSPVALNCSPYVTALGPVFEHNRTRYPRLDYVAQDHGSLGMLLGHEYNGFGGGDPLLPTHPDHPLVEEGRTWMALNSPTWLRALSRYDFSFGTRIHGNIAALLAGTPALVLAHDSRTLELARYHEIPHRDIRTLADLSLDAATLAAEADHGPTSAGHGERFATYVRFLDRHGLEHIWSPGHDAAAFDARIEAIDYPDVVRAGQAPPKPAPPAPTLRQRIKRRLTR